MFLLGFEGSPKVTNTSPASPAKKIEHLLGMGLDRVTRILTWPVVELEPVAPVDVWMQVWHIVWRSV
jgi:hypothetical protein